MRTRRSRAPSPILPTALALLACTACVRLLELRPVPPDGGGWRELRSSHFVLRTDLPADRARDLVAELEAVVDGLDRGLFRERSSRLPLAVDVVAFESGTDLDLFLPPNAVARVQGDVWSRLTIVMKGSFAEEQRAVVAHELTHVLMAASYARQPLWFQEGTACYAETIDWEESSGRIELGRVPRGRRWTYEPAATDLHDLLSAKRSLDAEQYSLAWGLVHFLIYREPDRFEAFQERLARGDEPPQAWRAIFPQWDPDVAGGAGKLRDELWGYLGAPLQFHRLNVQKPTGTPPSSERMLSAGEVHDVRLGLPWLNRGRPVPPEVFAAEVDAALASGSVLAAWIRGQREPAERLILAERAAREHPSDARAWLLLAAAVDDPRRAEEAMRSAVSAEPSSAAAHDALARHLLQSRRPAEALPHATEAVRLAPWSPSSMEALAAAVYAQGRCPDALRLQRRAVENVRDSDRVRVLERYLERLARLERACGATTP